MAEDETPILHTGKPVKVKWLGGESHGQEGVLRRPIKREVETAAPPLYKGNNFYDPTPGNLHYDHYFLRDHEGELYYVHENWLDDFPANIDKPFETTNQRLIREEKERGGPVDLVEGEGVPPEIKKHMNQNLVGRCDTCLRGVFAERWIGTKCNRVKQIGVCEGTIRPIEEFTSASKVRDSKPKDDKFVDPMEESWNKVEKRRSEVDKRVESHLAEKDFEEHGIAFLVDGKRVDPRRVKMMVRTKNPLSISLQDIIDGAN